MRFWQKIKEYDIILNRYRSLKKKYDAVQSDFLKDAEVKEIMRSIADIPYIEKFWETLIHEMQIQKSKTNEEATKYLNQKQGEINLATRLLREIESIKK